MYSDAIKAPSILDQFTPGIMGVFWITEESLSRDLVGFDDFNYLFDGLISQYLYGQEQNLGMPTHIFFTENFKEKIFLLHLKTKDLSKTQIEEELYREVALTQAGKNPKKTILVFDKTEAGWFAKLTNRYSELQFKSLEIVS